ncbi:hypothetical protein DRN85_10685, partial [Methanosarcinales archaeon]
SKTLQRLSTGLAINTAADNPSGLAISEKLRTQINGFERATANAQDAISFLQVAEGALNETHSILQRMRELAVQASNGVLTANDRQEIQKEVDQLSQEIDRIAKSTEFNTKKLLEGSGSALWSASNDDIEAIITGKVKEGNYKLEISNAPGQNHVLKTDIFSYKSGLTGINNFSAGGEVASITMTASGSVGSGGTSLNSAWSTSLIFNFGGDDITVTVSGAASDTGSASYVASLMANAINSNTSVNTYITAVISSGNSDAITIKALEPGTAGNSYTVREISIECGSGTVDNYWGSDVGTADTSFSGGMESVSGITGVSNPQNVLEGSYSIDTVDNLGAATTGTATLMGTYRQNGTAWNISGNTQFNISAGGSGITSSGFIMIEWLDSGTSGTDALSFKWSDDNGVHWYTETASNSGADLSAQITLQNLGTAALGFVVTAGETITSGDKMLIGITSSISATYDTFQISITTAQASLYNSVNNASTAAKTQPKFAYTGGATDNSTISLTIGTLDSTTGNFNFGTVDITVGTLGDSGSQDPTFEVSSSSGVANEYTKLVNIDRFYDANGNFILGDSGKYITIYNAIGNKTQVYIDGGDTLLDVVNKIKTAITTDVSDGGLGMKTSVTEVNENLVSFVSNATPNTEEAIQGTIVIRSPWQGKDGQLYFSADEDLLNALSLTTVQDPSDYSSGAMTVTVYNANTGSLVGTDTVTDGVLHNVIEGVDIKIDPNVDITPSWNATTRSVDFTSTSGNATRYIGLVDKSISFQIGANEGQTTESYIAQMDSKALGVDKVLVTDQNLAKKAITQVDDAIQSVSSERARIGGTISRLEHTINNLSVQEENQIAAESTIRDVDMAKEVSELTKQQILMQTATA